MSSFTSKKSWQRCELISYLLVEIFERPLNIPKRPSIENICILYNYGPGVRGMNAQRLPSSIWEHSHLCQDIHLLTVNSPVNQLTFDWMGMFLRSFHRHNTGRLCNEDEMTPNQETEKTCVTSLFRDWTTEWVS